MRHHSCYKQYKNDEIGTKGELKLLHVRIFEMRKVIEKTRSRKFLIKLLDNYLLNGVALEPKNRNAGFDSLEHGFNEIHINNND